MMSVESDIKLLAPPDTHNVRIHACNRMLSRGPIPANCRSPDMFAALKLRRKAWVPVKLRITAFAVERLDVKTGDRLLSAQLAAIQNVTRHMRRLAALQLLLQQVHRPLLQGR